MAKEDHIEFEGEVIDLDVELGLTIPSGVFEEVLEGEYDDE